MNAAAKRRIANGLCIAGCGRSLVTSLFCRGCLDEQKARKAGYVSKGLCAQGCGRALVTKLSCRECLGTRKAVKAKHRASGLCEHGCGRPRVNKRVCQECLDRDTAKKHGLKSEHYLLACEKIPNCQACGVVLTKGRGKAGRCVDHDHTTGVRRGFLCRSCNLALGALYESPAKIQALKDYIERCNARDK